MPSFEYKCLKCEERHVRSVEPSEIEERTDEAYFAPCPVCGFVARRVPNAEGYEEWRRHAPEIGAAAS